MRAYLFGGPDDGTTVPAPTGGVLLVPGARPGVRAHRYAPAGDLWNHDTHGPVTTYIHTGTTDP